MIWPMHKTMEDYSNLLSRDIKTLTVSDIHCCGNNDLVRLEELLEYCLINKFDYIFINGDILNNGDVNPYDGLLELLRKIGKAANISTLIVDGNHDRMIFDVEINKWVPFYNANFFAELNNIDDKINYLENECYEDELLRVFGSSLPFAYFEEVSADLERKKELYRQYLSKFDCDFNKKFGIFQGHDILPLYNHSDFFSSSYPISASNLIMGGHYHNGGIPAYIDKLVGGNFGIINQRIFPAFHPFKRGIKLKNNRAYVLAPALATTHIKVLDNFFPPSVMVLDIIAKKNKVFKRT